MSRPPCESHSTSDSLGNLRSRSSSPNASTAARAATAGGITRLSSQSSTRLAIAEATHEATLRTSLQARLRQFHHHEHVFYCLGFIGARASGEPRFMSRCVGVSCSGAFAGAHLLIDHLAAGSIYANHLLARAIPRGRALRMPVGHLKVELAVAAIRLSRCLGATFSDDKRLPAHLRIMRGFGALCPDHYRLHGRSFSGPVPCTVVWLATRSAAMCL
jgi:hypothetical protein